MLPSTPSLQELRDYLDEQNLGTICETANDEIFSHFTDSRGIDVQNSYSQHDVDARFWIQHDNATNRFVLNVSFFTQEGAGISREVFAQSFPAPNPATTYTSENQVTWVASGSNEYNVSCSQDIAIFRYFTLKIPTITKTT